MLWDIVWLKFVWNDYVGSAARIAIGNAWEVMEWITYRQTSQINLTLYFPGFRHPIW